ncbi:hypothetical protein HJFPF1_08792 [Paramyrothecium foliicola]|nr:hypothetical protein HJFPF1_08792 [Paramyrothecium foliicola]
MPGQRLPPIASLPNLPPPSIASGFLLAALREGTDGQEDLRMSSVSPPSAGHWGAPGFDHLSQIACRMIKPSPWRSAEEEEEDAQATSGSGSSVQGCRGSVSPSGSSDGKVAGWTPINGRRAGATAAGGPVVNGQTAAEAAAPLESGGDDDERPQSSGKQTPAGRVACPRPGCGKRVTKKCIADHIKLHHLSEAGASRRASTEQSCETCRKVHTACCVAVHPFDRKINTLRCLRCIGQKGGCSFLKNVDSSLASGLTWAQSICQSICQSRLAAQDGVYRYGKHSQDDPFARQ